MKDEGAKMLMNSGSGMKNRLTRIATSCGAFAITAMAMSS